MKEKKYLKDLITYSSRGISPTYSNLGYKVINQRCIRNNFINFDNIRFSNKKKKIDNKKLLVQWDVLINSTGVGTLGRVAQFKHKIINTTCDSHVMIVRPNLDIIDCLYFGYLIISKENLIKSLGKGTTGQTELSRNDLNKIEFSVIKNINQQKKISTILSQYDDLIENNTNRIKTINQIIHNEFEKWFRKFKFPGYKKINSEKIPEDWKLGKLKQICDVVPGYAFKSKDWKKEGVGVIKIKNINNNEVNIEQLDFVSKDTLNYINKKFFILNGDILIAMTGATAGKVGIFQSNNIFLLNQRVAKFVPKKHYYEYLRCFVTNPNIRNYFFNLASGTAQPNMSGKQLEDINLLIPSLDVLKKFSETISPLFKMINNLFFKNKILNSTKNILLPNLLSNKIDISNIDIEII